MAIEIIQFEQGTGVAGADFSLNQHHFVIQSGTTDFEWDLAVNGEAADGVLDNEPTAGLAASVVHAGIVKIRVGGAGLTRGDDIASDVNAEGAPATTGEYILGRALQSGAAGSLISMLWKPAGRVA